MLKEELRWLGTSDSQRSAQHTGLITRDTCASRRRYTATPAEAGTPPWLFPLGAAEAVIEADVNATILEDLAQPGQYQVGTRGRGQSRSCAGLRAAKYFGASLNFRERIFSKHHRESTSAF